MATACATAFDAGSARPHKTRIDRCCRSRWASRTAARVAAVTGGSGAPVTTAAAELLSAEQEVELGRAIEAGLYAEHLLSIAGTGDSDPELLREAVADGRAAFHRFVEANVRLAAWRGRRRVAAGGGGVLSVEDLTAEGTLGVIRALQKWDHVRGLKFSTYAYDWVGLHQQRAVAAAAPAGLAARDRDRCTELIGERQRLTQRLQRTPTRTELAAALGITCRAVEEIETMLAPAQSLDAPDHQGRTLADTLPAMFGPRRSAGAGGGRRPDR